jgi:cytochrome c oxidase cbb3-type subunit 3/ubiquinol-cytochrome c reductase cytochrome c subunit
MIAAGMTGQGPHDWQSYTTGGTAHPMTDQQLADVVAWLASHRVATPGQVYRQQQ